MMKRVRRIAIVTLFLAILILPNASPFVRGADISVSSIFFADDDKAVTYDALVNWANASATTLTERNLTIAPFQAANLDIAGTIVSPILAPTAVLRNATNLTIVQPVIFTQDSILDGVSYSWWRSPIGNISNGTIMNLQIYRSDSASNNVTTISHSTPYVTFNDQADAHRIWNWTGVVSDSMASFLGRRISIEVNVTKHIDYNFTWLSVYAPIFPNIYYYSYWHVVSPSTHQFTLFYTTNDIGNDGKYASWIKSNAISTKFIGVDLDLTMIMQYGMSSGIAGIADDCKFWNVTCHSTPFDWSPIIYFNLSFSPSVLITNSVGARRYFNVVQPIYNRNATDGVGLQFQLLVHNVESGDLIVTFSDQNFNKTDLLFQRFVDLDTYNGNYLHNKHVTGVDMRYVFPKNNSFMYIAADPNASSQIVTQIPCDLDPNVCSHFLYAKFKLYGFFEINNFFIDNTNRNIVLIPVEDPLSPLGRLQAFQRWQAQMKLAQQQAIQCDLAATFENIAVVTAIQGGTSGLTSGIGIGLAGLILNRDCAVQGILDGLHWQINTTLKLLANFFSPIADFLYSIGSFIWSIIQFLINATEWLLFWAVKFINVFIVLAVFAIASLSPMYVSRGIYEWAKSGYKARIMKDTMREGWDRVWTIIQMLLSLVTIVIGAIAAVAGIIGGLIP